MVMCNACFWGRIEMGRGRRLSGVFCKLDRMQSHWEKFLIEILVVTCRNVLPTPHRVAPPHNKTDLLDDGILSDSNGVTFLAGVLPAEVVGNVTIRLLLAIFHRYPFHPISPLPAGSRVWTTSDPNYRPHPLTMYECSGCGKRLKTPQWLSRHQKGCAVLKSRLKAGARKFRKAQGTPKTPPNLLSTFNSLISGDTATVSNVQTIPKLEHRP